MAKINSQLSTSIALDTVKASQSVNKLSSAISSLKTSNNYMVNSLKAVGDTLEASRVKYSGVTEQIDLQKQKIEMLKNQQEDLVRVQGQAFLKTKKGQKEIAEYTEKINKLNGDGFSKTEKGLAMIKAKEEELIKIKGEDYLNTQKGADAYLKAQRNIDRAESSLIRLNAQRTKAKNELDYQNSGLAKLKGNYENITSVAESYIKRLRESGEVDKANQEKIKLLGKQHENLSKQYKLEVETLRNLERSTDTSSDAIAKQRVRVNEIAAAMEKAKTESEKLNAELNQKPPTLFSKLKARIMETNTEATKTEHIFSKVFSANILSNAVTSGFAKVKDSFTSLIQSGVEYNKTQQVMRASWMTLTGSASKAQALVDMTNKLSIVSNNSADMVNRINQGFFALTKNKEKTQDLTKTILTLQDAFGKDDAAIENFSTQWGQMMGRGKANAEDMKSIIGVFPTFKDELLKYERGVTKNTHLTMQGLDDLISKGKITSEQMNTVLLKMGQKYKSATAEFSNTLKGAEKSVQTVSGSLVGALTKPFVNIMNPINIAVAKWATDTKTRQKFNALGQTTQKEVDKVLKAFNINPKKINVTKVLNKVVSKTQEVVKKLGDAIVKHKIDIKNFFHTLSDIKTGGLKTTMILLKAFTPILLAIAKILTKFPHLTAGVIMGFTAWNKGIAPVLKTTGKFSAFLKKNPEELGKFKGAFNKFGNAIKGKAKDITKGLYSSVKGLAKNVSKQVGDLSKLVWNNTKSLAKSVAGKTKELAGTIKNNVGKIASAVAENVKAISKSVWNGIKSLGGMIKGFVASTGPVGWILLACTAVATALVVLYNKNKWFHDKINGLAASILNTLKDAWEKAKNVAKAGFEAVKNMGRYYFDNWARRIRDVFDLFVGIITDNRGKIRHAFVDILNALLNPFSKMLDGLRRGINWILDKVGGSKIGGSWSFHIPNYAKGTSAHPGGLALVNDAPSTNYREMYKLPTGEMGMFPAQRNMLVNLPKGTEVLNGEHSASLAKALGVPGYAKGVGSFFSKIFEKGRDLMDDVDDILKHPIKFAEKVFSKFVPKTAKGFIKNILVAFPRKLAHMATKWIKKQFEDFGGGPGGPNPKGDAVLRWKPYVKRALKMNGLPTSSAYVNAWLRQIQSESRGNQNAVQGYIPGDPNNAPANRARGLVQCVPSTFNSNAFPGHHNIFNGFDNLLAGINYAKKTYGSAMLQVIGHGHGYANGGLITQHQIAEIGEGNQPEMIIPLSETKRSRGWELLGQVVEHFTSDMPSNGTHLSVNNSEELKQLNAKFDTLLGMFSQMMGLNAQQLDAIRKGSFNKQEMYRQQATDLNLADFQAF